MADGVGAGRKTRLELTWIGKENRPRLEPRILLEDAELSHHAAARVSEGDLFDNRLIFGDNLLALKALEQEFTGKVKCIFIDPPYNTGSAFTHYDDGVEHSIWLSLMRDRLELLRRLLREDGSLWITIDDHEAHYLKVLCDEVFGRSSFIANVVWEKKYAPANDAIWFSNSHDHVLVYARNSALWRPNRLERSADSTSAYKNLDQDPRGLWRPDNYKCNKTADERPNLFYGIKQPNTSKEIWPKRTAVWRYSEETHLRHVADNLVYWGKDGTGEVPAYKRFLHDVDQGVVAQTIWSWRDVGHNQDAKREQMALHSKDPFGTPKPESLLARIISIATRPGEFVLDSFAGSGTTGAVAHKMGRRWIMIELGEHIHSHIIPRMTKVIDGQDPGGVTEATGWKGGGGFRYFKLAPSLLEVDRFGNHIISEQYNPAMLAEAMCKLMGFRFAPDPEVYWQQGRSSETDYLFTTTQTLSKQQLEALSEEVGPKRSLLVCCSAFRGSGFANLTLKKIPMAVLARCEWGKDDYSLNVANLGAAPVMEAAEEDRVPAGPVAAKRPRAGKGPGLFGGGDE